MRLLLVVNLELNDLRKSVNKECDRLTEKLFYGFEVGLIRAILDRIVKQCRAYGIGVQFQSCHDLCNGDRVGDIRISAHPVLPAVELVCIFICLCNLFQIVLYLQPILYQLVQHLFHLVLYHQPIYLLYQFHS